MYAFGSWAQKGHNHIRGAVGQGSSLHSTARPLAMEGGSSEQREGNIVLVDNTR